MTLDSISGVVQAVRAWRAAGASAVELSTPWALIALVPLALIVLWPRLGRRPRLPTARFARTALAASLPRGRGHSARAASQALGTVAAALFIVTTAGPHILGEPDPALVEGIDIVLSLDISTSMLAADFRPRDRITVAKKVIEDHVLTRKNDRIGLVVFAGEAFTQAPLTHDTHLLREIIDGVRLGIITDGTAIGDGLALALARLLESKAVTRTVILLTDGDNNAGAMAPQSAAEMAQQMGVKVFCILVGKGGRVPFPDGVDAFGAPRYTLRDLPVNPALLKKIAADTGGAFFQATDRASLETSFQQILESLDRSVLEGAPLVRREIPLFPLVLMPAMLALLISLGLRLTRGSVIP